MKYLLLLLFCLESLFAIVTIKPADVGEKKPGISGAVLLSLNTYRGNTDTDATDIGGVIQFDTNHTVSFIKASYSYGEANGITNTNKAFIHTRNIYALFKDMDSELFYQLQNNAFQNLNLRMLLGMGARLHVGDPLFSGRGYLGLGIMHVTEEEQNSAQNDFEHYNIYLSYKLTPYPDMTLALVSYYQPRINDASDYLLLSTAEFDYAINKKLTLTFSVNYSVDSKPASGVKPEDFSQHTALNFKF